MEPLVLLVDDDPDFLALLAALVASAGARSEAVTTAAAALDLLDARPYAAILAEVRAPERAALALAERLRRRGLETPLVVVTEDTDPDLYADCLRAGAHDLLTKPIEPFELVNKVAQLAQIPR